MEGYHGAVLFTGDGDGRCPSIGGCGRERGPELPASTSLIGGLEQEGRDGFDDFAGAVDLDVVT